MVVYQVKLNQSVLPSCFFSTCHGSIPLEISGTLKSQQQRLNQQRHSFLIHSLTPEEKQALSHKYRSVQRHYQYNRTCQYNIALVTVCLHWVLSTVLYCSGTGPLRVSQCWQQYLSILVPVSQDPPVHHTAFSWPQAVQSGVPFTPTYMMTSAVMDFSYWLPHCNTYPINHILQFPHVDASPMA